MSSQHPYFTEEYQTECLQLYYKQEVELGFKLRLNSDRKDPMLAMLVLKGKLCNEGTPNTPVP